MKPLIENYIAPLYSLLIKAGSALQPLFLLAVRLYWGWQFMQTGWGKLHNIPHVIQFFTNLGIPAPGLNAWFVSFTEFVGGILLALGLGSRFFALLLAGDMLVAYIVSDRLALLSVFSDPGKFYNADPYTFLFASLLVLIFGPGMISLDHYLSRRFESTRQTVSVPRPVATGSL
jgi:putative oxidoreductase